ncbi:MAG: division/cell wall cluster transcriptional repressor MraZ [bacterium TMED88]|nr:division/cell wall cluster transcriptional repressor MraZ [Deltaproteobacteria bacterium]OUV28732.1 MAG: division/cell wall cluster transcriptional repressor MraZ [bacterium TMED88]
MFRGRFEHSMDAKGRLSVPSGFRMELQRRSEKAPVLTNHGDHLALYPADVWEQKEQQLLDFSDMQPDVQDFQRYVVADANDAPLDGQGRILVPALLRNEAGLGSKVLLAGVLQKIEIWDPERFEEKKRMTLRRLDEIQKSVDGHRDPRGA